MVEWSNELLENMKRFRDETGMSYEQMKKAGDDAPPYDDEFLEMLAEEGLTPEENREALLRDTMELLTSDKSLEAVKTLQDRIGFTPRQLTEMLTETYHEAENLLETMVEAPNLKNLEVLVKLGGVDPQIIANEIASGAGGEDKGEIVDGATFDNMIGEVFPDADNEKLYDDVVIERDIDDPELKEALGEPKQGFASKVKDSRSGGKFR